MLFYNKISDPNADESRRFGMFGILLTICIGSFLTSNQKMLDLGLEVFIPRVAFIHQMKG